MQCSSGLSLPNSVNLYSFDSSHAFQGSVSLGLACLWQVVLFSVLVRTLLQINQQQNKAEQLNRKKNGFGKLLLMGGQALPGFCASGGVRATRSIMYPSRNMQARKGVLISPAMCVNQGTNVARMGMDKRTQMTLSLPHKFLQDRRGRLQCFLIRNDGFQESLLFHNSWFLSCLVLFS